MNEPKSKCCNAPVKVGGEGTTHYYVCSKCNEVCDVKEEPKQSWEERLEELNKRLGLGTVGLFEVKQIISQEIQKATAEADRKAREEERKLCNQEWIMKLLKGCADDELRNIIK